MVKIRQGDVLLVLSLAEAVEGRGDGKVKGDDVVVVVVRCLEVGTERRFAGLCVACCSLLWCGAVAVAAAAREQYGRGGEQAARCEDGEGTSDRGTDHEKPPSLKYLNIR